MGDVDRFTDEEHAVQADLRRLLQSPGADEAYNQLEGTFDGRLLNADLARELSSYYRGKYDRLAFTRCTYGPCAQYIRDRFGRAIRGVGGVGQRVVLFLAGGAASGKTRSVGHSQISMYDLVFDSNLADFNKAESLIDDALTNGWQVDILYIHRPYKLACAGMVERAVRDGRYIPLGYPSKLARLHFDAQRTIIRLRSRFPEELVRISALANLYSETNPVNAVEISLSELEKGGRFHYHSLKELHDEQDEIIEEFKNSSQFEEGVLQALCETES